MHERYTDETAYTLDNLEQLLDSNDATPDWVVDPTYLDRLVDMAEQRAAARGEDSALDESQVDCIITAEWQNFLQPEFGYSGDDANAVALGVVNPRASADRDAILFNDTAVVQTDWLRSGDGRKTQTRPYMDEEYDNAEEGEFWVPRGATDYVCIIALSDELVHGSPNLAEAM